MIREEKTKMGIDYTGEVKKLGEYEPENSKFWKPEAGQHTVEALSELQEAPPFQKDGEPDKPQAQILLKLADETEVVWTVSQGKTLASTYGQLCNLANELGGTLKGVKFMVHITSDGKKRSYAIIKL